MRWLGSAVWNWIYRFPARMVSCGGGRSRLLPFRPLSRRSGCVPALPYPPLRYFQSGSHQPRRARIFHRTATTPLTFCLTGRVHPTRLPRYLCPSPTPRWSAVLSDAVRRSLPHDHPGPPLLTQTTFLACCAHYPGGPIRAAGYRYGALPRPVLPDRLSLPRFSAGSAPHWAFRGLLELYTRYGLPSRSPTFLWTLSRGSDPASFPTEPLACYRI